MSAMNCIKFTDCVIVCTDGCHYDAEGVIWKIQPKAMTLPHLRAVVASRGPALATMIFANELGGVNSSFDSLIETIEDKFEELCEKYENVLATDLPTRIELLVAGWSDNRARPESYIICSPEDAAAAIDVSVGIPIEAPPYKLIELPAELYGPGIPKHIADRAALKFNSRTEATHVLRAVLEMQRDIRHCDRPGHPKRLIGGFGLAHTISQHGITEEVICRWDDRIGHPIDLAEMNWEAWRKLNGWQGQTENVEDQLQV